MNRPYSGHLRVAGWVLILQLGGCASTPFTDQLVQHPPNGLPAAIELGGVAFFPQEIHQCGPASLAMVLQPLQPDITPEQLSSEVYIPDLKGSLQPEILAATRRHGFIPYELAPQLDAVLREVQQGRPVLVLQNLGFNWWPQWHYAVVIGYDLTQQTIVLHSGTTARHELGLKTFERTWQRAHYWAMVALRPGTLPVQPDPTQYLQAIVGLEKIHRWTELHLAYQAGLRQWPHDQELHMGLGNLFYLSGDKSSAQHTYETVLRESPEYAPAHNNLAEVLADLGQWDEAVAHARRALQLGGVHASIYSATLQSILTRRTQSPDHKN
ncbi:MAG: PA2778 family cysteine peptidase [Gammaproteobacteria bacterium]|nr:PA2778 family cysteine peptidase [Gammaproteobacteria bacterium]